MLGVADMPSLIGSPRGLPWELRTTAQTIYFCIGHTVIAIVPPASLDEVNLPRLRCGVKTGACCLELTMFILATNQECDHTGSQK